MVLSVQTALLTTVVAIALTYIMLSSLFKKKWDPKGKHCFITGGSAGTGLSLAILLTKKGADVSIVARNKERLDKALSELEAVRQSPSQKLHAYSFAVDNPEGAAASLEAAAATHDGKCPDALFLCAGASRPSFFVEETGEGLRKGMEMTYWSQAFSALAGVKRMVKDGVKGKIVFVSSVLGYFSIVGYSTYSPGKFAIRGLAEALQSECMLYDIDIHAAFPGTIFSPGLEEEQKHKPKVTLKIEETDDGATPEVVAAGILKGVQRGNFHITYDFIGNVFRASTRGSSPGNNVFVDTIYGLIGWIALPIWRKTVDSTVRAHRAEHLESLRQKGLVA